MPGKVKVKIISGRNLPVMDRSSDTTDAYVEIKLGTTTFKTDVCRKSLHPHWNSEWYRFEVDDSELQDEPLQIRLMDHDTYSANDAIGKVYLDLNPLLLPTALSKYGESSTNHEHSSNSVMSGWIPVYDTMHGIRGEVHIIVKVELFSDFNRFRQSSCGIQFFCSQTIPQGYFAQIVHGFVEELVVNDDPEYQWIDKIRTPRASNEARQTLFFKLSGELQRKIGVKALDMGANAVIGYCQCFDLEGESGIVARGIGTAVTLIKLVDLPQANIGETNNEECALNYLKFLGSDSGFCLNAEAKKIYMYPQKLISSPLESIDLNNPRYKQVARHISNLSFTQNMRYTHSNPSLTTGSIYHPSLKTLLKQEDMRGTPGYGISQKIKNLKYTSQSVLSKKMIALKAKLGDTGICEDSYEDSKLFKVKKKRKLKRTISNDSSVMAELLARSAIHAQTSLGCILENQDHKHAGDTIDIVEEEGDKKCSFNDLFQSNTINELEPIANLLEKTDSEPYLSMQDNLDMQSNLSVTSSESSSSDDDDNLSDSVESNIDFETVSNIVKNVELLEKEYHSPIHKKSPNLSKQISLPAIPYDLDLDESELDEINPFTFPSKINTDEKSNLENNIQISSNDEKEIANNVDNLDNLEEKAPIVEPESFSSTEDNSELNVNEENKTQHTKMIIPPVMMGAVIKPQGLVKTAMQTILLEKVNIMGTYSPPVSPNYLDTDNKFFNVGSQLSSTNSSPTPKQSNSFLSNYSQLLRSSTILSLNDQGSNKCENVLTIPFSSLNDVRLRRQRSHPFLKNENNKNANKQYPICLSDSELHKTNKKSKRIITKNKFAFMNLLGKTSQDLNQVNVNKKTNSHEHIAKKRFSFLHINRRKSHQPTTNLEKSKSTSDVSNKNKFLFFKKIGKSSEILHNSNVNNNKSKSHSIKIFFHKRNKFVEDKPNLLNTALGNVVMETVQDILATSSPDKEKSCPDIPSSSKLITNNNNNTLIEPVNIKIDDGLSSNNKLHASLSLSPRSNNSLILDVAPIELGHHRSESTGTNIIQSPAKLNSVPCIHRRSSDSDLSITPKGNSLTGSDRSRGGQSGQFMKTNILLRSTVPQDNFDMLEYPFLTMSKYPSGFILQLGGAVSARSVKLLERISNLEEPESRDTWWSEIRMEIRSHARALNCNAVLGYFETTSICEDICVLSASGTAAVIGFQNEIGDNITGLPIIPKTNFGKDIMTSSLDRNDFEKDKILPKEKNVKQPPDSPDHEIINNYINAPPCTICHLPYNSNNVPIRAIVLKCGLCRSGKVPDVLLATIETPDSIPSIGRGCFIQSYVCRQLKDLKGESNAKEISDGLPFLEYELHRLLVNKLKIKGMNAVFGLKIRISIGEKMLVGIATGTAIFLTSLPIPILPKLVSDRSTDEKKLADLQKHLHETVKRNKEIYQIKNIEEYQNGRALSDNDDSEDELISVDLSMGNKDCCVLEVDDPEDAEVLNLIMEERPPDGFHVVNTEFVPGLEELEIVKNLQMFTQIYRAKIQQPFNLEWHFRRLLQTIYFKLRRMVPCALCDLKFRVDLPEPDEIQLCVLGMALGLGDPQKVKIKRRNTITKRNDDDLIFNLDEDQIPENSVSVNTPVPQHSYNMNSFKHRQKSPLRNRIQSLKQRHVPYRERHGVDITPLSYVPGGKIERYLGNLNFFFIRETTSIREEGGLSGFIHSFVTEVLAIVRAHVTALGGNAMVAYFLTECVLNYNLHKNQAWCGKFLSADKGFIRSYLLKFITLPLDPSKYHYDDYN